MLDFIDPLMANLNQNPNPTPCGCPNKKKRGMILSKQVLDENFNLLLGPMPRIPSPWWCPYHKSKKFKFFKLATNFIIIIRHKTFILWICNRTPEKVTIVCNLEQKVVYFLIKLKWIDLRQSNCTNMVLVCFSSRDVNNSFWPFGWNLLIYDFIQHFEFRPHKKGARKRHPNHL